MILILEKDSKRADLLEQLVKGTEKYDVTTLACSAGRALN
jgi:hypothetical protein